MRKRLAHADDIFPRVKFSLIFILFAIIVAGLVFASLLSGIVCEQYGINIQDVISSLQNGQSADNIQILRTLALFNTCFGFLIPAFAFAHIYYRSDAMSRLYLDVKPGFFLVVIFLLTIISSMPIVEWLYIWNKNLPLPEWLVSQTDENNQLVKSLLQMNAPKDLIINLFVMAILPAIGEELVFRSLVQVKFTKLFSNHHLGIWITAFIFSFIHLQFDGFFSRLLLGVILGYGFWFTQSIWVTIIAHLFFNGIQVTASYVMIQNGMAANADVEINFPIYAVISSVILTAGGLWFLYNHFKRTYIDS